MRAFVVALVLVVPLLAGCTSSPDDTAGHSVPGIHHRTSSRAAPDFTVTTMTNETITLSGLQGQVVLLYFMGLSCTSCARNLPDHQRLYDEYQDEPRFEMVALNAWASFCGEACPTPENETNMRAYVREHDIGWHLAFSPPPLIDAYDVGQTPAQFFIDADGTEHSFGGVLSFDAMRTEIDFLLGRSAGSA